MFKKVLALVLCVAFCFSACLVFTSCGEEKSDFKAALICLHGDSSTYDKNFIEAFKTACANKGVSYDIVTDVPEDTLCYDKAAQFADDGYGIVFADSFGHEPYILQAAKEFPDVQFCHATGTQAHTADQSNFQDSFASIYEGRYLAGVAAGLKLLELYDTDKDGKITDAESKIGYVGAWPYAEVISGYTSFYLGVKSVVSNVTMTVKYTNSWYDEAAEKTTALALIDEGCKLISQHADSMGAPTACEERNIPNVAYNGATGLNTFVVASRIDWTSYFEYAIDCAMNGKDIADDWTGSIQTGSVVLSDLGKAAAAGTAEKLAEVSAKLQSGETKVFDCSAFTVNGEHLTSYLADVDDDGTYTADTEVIKTENGVTYFDESSFRSAPYFNIVIDGITIGK